MATDTVELRSGALRCVLVPNVGAAIAGLWFEDLPVLRCTPVAELATPRQGGSFALVPYSNRIGNGRLEWGGEHFTLKGPVGDAPHTIHGVGWQRPWQVIQQSAHSVTLQLDHAGDAAWPFPFSALQTVTLQEDGVELQLTVLNQHTADVPMGLGWHPYLTKRPGAHLQFQVARQWLVGPDRLPTQAVDFAGLNGPCDTLQMDHCFSGWTGIAVLQDAQLRTTLTADLNHLVVYTDPSLPFVAVEPVSHLNNALQLAAAGGLSTPGMPVVAPSGSQQARARIGVERAPQRP